MAQYVGMRTRHLRMVATVAAAVVIAACAPTEAGPSDGSTTTTTFAEVTTTSTAPSTTSTTLPASTTTTVPAADPAEVAVIEAQAHGVVMDFLDRAGRIGPSSGRRALTSSDPFGGAVAATLRLGDGLSEYAEICINGGGCAASEWGDKRALWGRVEALLEAGSAGIAPYGDGSYYVSGAYAARAQEGFITHYVGGFRFRVESGRAVLVDLVTWDRDVAGRASDGGGTWLSRWSYEGSQAQSSIRVAETASGVSVKPVFSGAAGMTVGLGGYVVFDVTNNTGATILPRIEDVAVWTQPIAPGATARMFARIPGTSGGTTAEMRFGDRDTGQLFFALEVDWPTDEFCKRLGTTTEPTQVTGRECVDFGVLAQEHGFADHRN